MRSDFVSALVADLRAVSPAPPVRRALTVWTLGAIALTATATLVLGPLREHALSDLTTPRLSLEFLFGTATLLSLTVAALEAGVPGSPRFLRSGLPGLSLVFALCWLAIAIGPFALAGPEPSMLGKREHCFLEGLAIGLLPAILGLHMIRGRSLRAGALTGALIGAAAGTLPALAMQIACMYEPNHALHFHFTPILVGAVVMGGLGALLQARD